MHMYYSSQFTSNLIKLLSTYVLRQGHVGFKFSICRKIVIKYMQSSQVSQKVWIFCEM